MLWSDLERFGSFFDPWRDFERLNRSLALRPSRAAVEFPPVNIWASDDHATLTTEIPGIDPNEIEISLVGNTVTLKGTRTPENLQKGESYHRRERWHGRFSKTVQLPFKIEASRVEAHFAHGVLTISLPRAEAEKPKKITVKSS